MWDSKTKAKIVLEVIGGVMTPAGACRKYELAESVLARWKREFLERAYVVFGEGSENGAEESSKAAEIEELQRMIGKQAIELEALKKGLGILQQGKGRRW
jgi:transposase-like protein